ncbi:leucine-rich repeat domain-containing protein [Allomuricauda sp. R78024]|uniref:leucine-rich repeat domain-containing protein n=1 Tax=Allomuricauda sp. R78024 TaxID=3093867 RepID=UPI0037C6A7C3
MKKSTLLMLLSALCLTMASCSKDKDDEFEDNIKVITSFVFLATDNDALSEDVKADVDRSEQTITAEVPSGTNITSLRPTIGFSEDAEVSPKQKVAKDFSEPIEYKITAQDGTERIYDVTVTVGKSDAKTITSFQFLTKDNETLSEDVKAEIDEEAKTITAEMPFGTDVTALKPVIEISEKAGAAPGIKETVDFSEAVTYKIMAEDGSEVEYVVSILLTEPTDRQVLIEFFNANPDNVLSWDLEDEDISNWENVIVENGRVVKLRLDAFGIDSLPASIGYLSNLRELNFDKNNITSIPPSIGNLTKLIDLFLSNNALSSIPDEIGTLANLNVLHLNNNALTNIPASIGNLTNLEYLWIQANQITTIPKEICNLIEDFRKDETATCEE